MKVRIKGTKDFFSGLLILAIGCVPLLLGPGYGMGSAARMGPGYLPTLIGGILALLGVILVVSSLAIEGEGVPAVSLRPVIVIFAALIAFTVLVDRAGFVIAASVLILGSACASGDFRLKEVVVLSIALVGASIGLFVEFLGMPFRLWPG